MCNIMPFQNHKQAVGTYYKKFTTKLACFAFQKWKQWVDNSFLVNKIAKIVQNALNC